MGKLESLLPDLRIISTRKEYIAAHPELPPDQQGLLGDLFFSELGVVSDKLKPTLNDKGIWLLAWTILGVSNNSFLVRIRMEVDRVSHTDSRLSVRHGMTHIHIDIPLETILDNDYTCLPYLCSVISAKADRLLER